MATTSRELIEYVWTNRPRVKLADVAEWFGEPEGSLREAIKTRQLFGVIRIVGQHPAEYLMPVTSASNLGAYLAEAESAGCILDGPLPESVRHAAPTE
jgi:hypothetical protein